MSLITESLAQYRAVHGLSQLDLAKLLGVHQTQIGRLESGCDVPSIATLQRLTAFFGFTDAQLAEYVRSVDAVRVGKKTRRKSRSRTRNARPPQSEALAA